MAQVKASNDQVFLERMARNPDNSFDVQEAAIKKLTDQTALAGIARDGNSRMQEAAVRKLTNQPVLAEIARNDRTLWIRIAAVETMTDRGLLSKIAKEHEEREVRRAAEIRLGR